VENGSRWTIFVIAALLSLFLALTGQYYFDGEMQSDQAPEHSTFSNHTAGFKALFMLGQQVHPDVRRWMIPYQLLDEGPIGTMVSYLPTSKPTEKELESLLNWIDEGGRLIVLTNDSWLEENKSHIFLENRDGIEFWNAADVLNNEGLKSDIDRSLPWLQNLFWESGPVYFDEFHSGFDHQRSLVTLTALFMRYPSGLFSLHILLAIFIGIFGCRLQMDRHFRDSEAITDNVYQPRLGSLEKLFRYVNSAELLSSITRKYQQLKGK
jgi:hypothetical protein